MKIKHASWVWLHCSSLLIGFWSLKNKCHSKNFRVTQTATSYKCRQQAGFANGKTCFITDKFIPLSQTGNKATSFNFMQELPSICPGQVALLHTTILYTKSIPLPSCPGTAVIALSLPALFRRDLWAARIQQSLWKGEDGSGGKPNCTLEEIHLKNDDFWQHFLTPNINALLVLVLEFVESPGQPTGRISGSKLHFARFSVWKLVI